MGSKAQIILADPVGSTLAGIVNDGVPGPEGSYTVEGIGQNFVPDTADMSLIDKAYSIPDAEAIATARELLLKEGNPGRLVVRHPDRLSPALVPRADGSQDLRDLRLRTPGPNICPRSTTTPGWRIRAWASASCTATCRT